MKNLNRELINITIENKINKALEEDKLKAIYNLNYKLLKNKIDLTNKEKRIKFLEENGFSYSNRRGKLSHDESFSNYGIIDIEDEDFTSQIANIFDNLESDFYDRFNDRIV